MIRRHLPKCSNCSDELKSTRGKSTLCQPCSARNLMHKKWTEFGDTTNGAMRFLDEETRNWLLEQCDKNKVRLSVFVASIIKDAYYEEVNDESLGICSSTMEGR